MNLKEESERWLSVEEIAFHLGVSKESIYRWTEKRKIPAHRLGRQWKFKATEVDEWMKSGTATTISEQKIMFNPQDKNEI